jgi:hypothetical protein
MPGPAKVMALGTAVCLVALAGYSVVFGASGLLWSGWVVLGLCTAGVTALEARR